jgi:tetratricopeptide (TPR) repeat protein
MNAPKGNDPLEYIFGDLLDTFTPSETAVLAALAHFTRSAQVAGVADIAALPRSVALTALEDLADRALLVEDEASEHFYLPPLAATFLKRARPEAVAQTGNRLADHAYALASENGYRKYVCFPVLEDAWSHIEGALPHLFGGDNDRLQTVCQALTFFLDFSGRWDEQLALHQHGESRALAANDFFNAGWRAYWVGVTHYRRGQVAETQACAIRCAAHWEQVKPGTSENAFALRLRGLAQLIAKEYPAAIATFQEVLRLRRVLDPDSIDTAMAMNDLAEVERLHGDYQTAERDYREALRIAHRVSHSQGVVIYQGNLAELAFDQKDWGAAVALARDALELAERLGRQELVGWNSYLLAQSLAHQGQQSEGLPYARQAVNIFTHLRQPDELQKAQAALSSCEK